MTPGSQQPRYIEVAGYEINQDMIDELRGCVIQGNLKRFEANVREIKRHQVTSARSEQEILDEFRAIVVQLYDNGFKNPLATFDNARQILRQSRQHPGGRE